MQEQKAALHVLINLIRGLYKSLDDDWRKVASSCGVTTAQQHLLWILHFSDGSALTELSELGLWHVSTVMNMVDRMEAADLVRKEIDSTDARIKRVYLTEKGRRVRKQTEENLHHFRLLDVISEMDSAELQQSMKPLYDIVNRLTGENYVKFVENTARLMQSKG